MDLFSNGYYNQLPPVFSLAGLWPYQTVTNGRYRRIFLRVCLLHYLTLEVFRIVGSDFDMDVTVQIIPAMFITVTSFIKFESTWFNMRTVGRVIKMKSVLDWMKDDWETVDFAEELQILRKFARFSRIYMRIYITFLELASVTIAFQQFWPNILDIVLPLNETRPRYFVFDVENFVDPDKYYYIIALHTLSGMPVCLFAAAGFDLFYTTSIFHACSVCAVLGYRFERFYQELRAHECSNKVKCLYRKEVERCIDKHQMLIRFTNHINLCYATSLTLQIPWAAAGWTFVLFYLFKEIVIEQDASKTAKHAINFVGYIVGSVYLTLPAQLLRDYSLNLHNSITFGDWNEGCRPIKKMMISLIQSSSKELLIYFAHGIPLCSETVMMLTKLSVSYFMVLYSLYGE